MNDCFELSIKTILALSKIYLKGISLFHQRYIQSLAIELFKVKGNLSNNIMYDIFQTRKINLRSQAHFASYCVNTNKFGLNSLRYFASKVWRMVPLEIKNSESVEILKIKIRNW